MKPFQYSTVQPPVKALSWIAVSDNSEKFQPTTSMKNLKFALGHAAVNILAIVWPSLLCACGLVG